MFRVVYFLVLLLVTQLAFPTKAQDSEGDTEKRLFEYIVNESDVNEGYVVFQRTRFEELDENAKLKSAYEYLGRIIRKKDLMRHDTQVSSIDQVQIVRPLYTESSLQIGRRILNYNSGSAAMRDVDPAVDPNTKPGKGMLSKRVDPIRDAIGTYGDFLHGPSKDWTVTRLGTVEVLADAELPRDAWRVLLGFPRTGAGVAVITFNGVTKYLPDRLEWKISPNAKRVASRPSIDEAMKWATHDTASVMWKKVEKNWVPVKHEHIHSWNGATVNYSGELTGWTFELKDYEDALDPKKFFAGKDTPLDYDSISELFEKK